MTNTPFSASEAKSVVELIRGASIADLAIVSLLVLPILIGAWVLLFNLIGVFPETSGRRLWVVVGVAAFYVAAIVIMKRSEGSRARKLRTVRRIYNTLERRRSPNQGFGSFEYVRDRVDPNFTNEFLTQLIEEFPDHFVKGRTKTGTDAIKLVLERPEN